MKKSLITLISILLYLVSFAQAPSNPTFSGDTIHVECEVVEARLTSRPGRGLVRTKNHIINQNDVTVITYTPLRMIKCKNPSITKND